MGDSVAVSSQDGELVINIASTEQNVNWLQSARSIKKGEKLEEVPTVTIDKEELARVIGDS